MNGFFSSFFSLGSLVVGGALAAQMQPTQPTVRVVDGQRKQSIPYASVGVVGRPLGTVADAQGGFAPARVGAAPTDTVVVSCVGYQSR